MMQSRKPGMISLKNIERELSRRRVSDHAYRRTRKATSKLTMALSEMGVVYQQVRGSRAKSCLLKAA